MSLPPFKDLEIYASGQKDLPQRFYVDPEQENFADWELSAGGETFKVHSQVLAMSSKVFCGMYQVEKPTVAIELPGSSTATLAEMLALLRFIYNPKSVTLKNIHLLSLQGYLDGVLRLANGIDCSFLDDCKRFSKKLLIDWPKASNAAPSANAVAEVNHEFNHVKVIRQFSIDIGDGDLHEGCYAYVRKRWLEASHNFTAPVTCEDFIALARELSDYPDLFSAGSFFGAMRKVNYTGKTIRRVLDYENYFPPALYTFKFQVTGNEEQQRIEPIPDLKNLGFEDRCTLVILRREEKFLLCLGIPQNVNPGPKCKVDMTLCIFNWTHRSKSYTIPRRFDFNDAAPTNHYSWAVFTLEELNSFLDEDGILYVQVTELKEIAAPVLPPVVDNNNN